MTITDLARIALPMAFMAVVIYIGRRWVGSQSPEDVRRAANAYVVFLIGSVVVFVLLLFSASSALEP